MSARRAPIFLPDTSFEEKFTKQGCLRIAGLDEVGRGCLAGPVVAAAVVLDLQCVPEGLNDSKKLSETKRQLLDDTIRKQAVAWAVGEGSVEEIDSINILNASKRAMLRALEQMSPRPDLLLIDGNFRIDTEIRQVSVVKGDQRSVSIAAASIVAKVHRDGFMKEMDATYPGYGFASNKGYGSKTHRLWLQKNGETPLHRRSFQWTSV